ncbi:PREDICTED: probable N-acetyltransferase 16 [Nanorana parkeri]|uniref:probable N-acetyltransferase 16 n=1 Tax=Nanorana parkeri TaxID=125878 RepID=UPI0008543687|nr:PREDICTED: probable N-acetyltransferase 16 [Nanorana parkeri]
MSVSSMAHIDFVPASAEDYKELMSISGGIYNGMDYLPFRYYEWLKDHRRHMFLAKSDGKIVAFESFLLVDGSSTAVLQGLRVAPWMRGQGITGAIQRYCLDRLRSDHPKVKRVHLTRGEDPPPSLLKMFKVINSKALVSMILPSNQLEEDIKLLEAHLDNVGQVNHSVLEPAEVLKLFNETKTVEDLLTGGLLVQDWLPLSTHRSNLEILFERRIAWIYSQSRNTSGSLALPDENSAGSADGHQTNHENIMSRWCGSPSTPPSSAGFLSLGTPAYPVAYANATYVFHIDMFGVDPASLRIHVLEQIKLCIQSLPEASSLICFMYTDECLRSELTDLCEGLTPFFVIKNQMILEMEF